MPVTFDVLYSFLKYGALDAQRLRTSMGTRPVLWAGSGLGWSCFTCTGKGACFLLLLGEGPFIYIIFVPETWGWPLDISWIHLQWTKSCWKMA